MLTETQPAALVLVGNGLLLVARPHPGELRQDPDLQEMRGLLRRMVELAVLHAPAGAHALHVAGRDGLDVAHGVLVGQFAFEHVTDDLHVAVAMPAEALAGRHPVLVDHPQVAEAHVFPVVVIGKGKTVLRLEPAMVGMAAVFGLAYPDHGNLPIGWRPVRPELALVRRLGKAPRGDRPA